MPTAAYQRIKFVDDGLRGILPEDPVETALALAHLQIEATLATAKAMTELQGELEGIRTAIMTYR